MEVGAKVAGREGVATVLEGMAPGWAAAATVEGTRAPVAMGVAGWEAAMATERVTVTAVATVEVKVVAMEGQREVVRAVAMEERRVTARVVVTVWMTAVAMEGQKEVAREAMLGGAKAEPRQSARRSRDIAPGRSVGWLRTRGSRRSHRHTPP